MARRKKNADLERSEQIANQLQRLILASERCFTGEISRMALKEITEESRRVLHPEEGE